LPNCAPEFFQKEKEIHIAAFFLSLFFFLQQYSENIHKYTSIVEIKRIHRLQKQQKQKATCAKWEEIVQ
jgi:hypothetical protein